MADPKKSTPAEDLIASLLKDVGDSDLELSSDSDAASSDDGDALDLDMESSDDVQGPVIVGVSSDSRITSLISPESGNSIDDESSDLSIDESPAGESELDLNFLNPPTAENNAETNVDHQHTVNESVEEIAAEDPPPMAPSFESNEPKAEANFGESEKTVAVTGYQIKASDLDIDDKVKVSVGQNRGAAFSAGYASWGSGVEGNLGQAENLRIAQDKIIELERENEKLRQQNEELMSASEIIKERSDLLTAQVTEFKNDRDGLEESFKNEMTLLKSHLVKRDTELQKAQFKIDELESRLKFDMKKIRIRERELENRLELVRAEKNAILKNKDEQILDLRRKMDIIQMEVESYRQKCVELNKLIETNQDSFKRTTRALRLAMASLELQEENKVPLKKVD